MFNIRSSLNRPKLFGEMVRTVIFSFYAEQVRLVYMKGKLFDIFTNDKMNFQCISRNYRIIIRLQTLFL